MINVFVNSQNFMKKLYITNYFIRANDYLLLKDIWSEFYANREVNFKLSY